MNGIMQYNAWIYNERNKGHSIDLDKDTFNNNIKCHAKILGPNNFKLIYFNFNTISGH